MSSSIHAKGFSPVLAAPELSPDLLPPLEMDGYLTGVLLTPGVEPRAWVSGLWDKRPAYDDENTLEELIIGVVARMRTIEGELKRGWPGYHPSFSTPGVRADHARVRTWVRGFWRAIKLDPEYWSDLAESDRTDQLLGIFSGFIDTGEVIEERADADEIRDEHIALMPRTIVALWKIAQMCEGNQECLRNTRTQKIGRNDPCPCGSGRKFKRCCAV